jgi:phosphatidylserine synthase
MDRQYTLTLPNLLSGTRLLLAPVLLVQAWKGYSNAFIVLAVIAFVFDALDGPIARWLNQVSELGPRLDTWADLAIYTVLPACLWWLWPEIIRRELLFVTLILAGLLFPGITGLIRFRRLTSYHTWLVKFSVLVTAFSLLALILGGPAMPFRVASFVCLAAGLEEVLITLVLDKPRSDVRSLYHVLRDQTRAG